MKYKAILKWDNGFSQEWESANSYEIILRVIAKCDYLSYKLKCKYEDISIKVIGIDESNNKELDLTERIFYPNGILTRLMKHRRKRKEEI